MVDFNRRFPYFKYPHILGIENLDSRKIIMTEEKPDSVANEEKENGPKEENDTATESSLDKKNTDIEDTDGSNENKKEEKSTPAQKYTNWPLKEIKEPHDNDVLYGRGGGTNHHPGNKRYRKMVEDRKLDYVNSKRLDKPLVALEIIKFWRSQEPPGRFLKLDEKTGLWQDVGDKKAREKTSQALREKAPEIRRKQEEEAMVKAGKDPSIIKQETSDVKNKLIRFDSKTKDQREHDETRRAALLRAHSLGQEYLTPGENVTLDGFTWDPSQLDDITYPSGGNIAGAGYPAGRHTSYGSQGAMPPQFPPSRDGSRILPPSGAEFYPNVPHDERQQSFSSTSSWARIPSGGAPPQSPYGGSSYPVSSNSFGRVSREHSLSHNPLLDASTSTPANQSSFDRSGSGYWSRSEELPNVPPPLPHAMPPSYGNSSGSSRYKSGGINSSGEPSMPPPNSGQAPFSLDPALANNWSAQSQDYEKVAGMLGEDMRNSWTGEVHTNTRLSSGGRPFNLRASDSVLPRPDIVKRMTSNQNEDFETKPDLQPGRSVKRAALNRDNSMASNRLKEQFPITSNSDTLKKPNVLEGEMRSLSISTEQLALDAAPSDGTGKPIPLATTGRVSTIEQIASEILGDGSKPLTLQGPTNSAISRPPVLRTEGRMSTTEYLDIVNEPLGQDDGGMNKSDWLSP